jgi:hypothetical protein
VAIGAAPHGAPHLVAASEKDRSTRSNPTFPCPLVHSASTTRRPGVTFSTQTGSQARPDPFRVDNPTPQRHLLDTEPEPTPPQAIPRRQPDARASPSRHRTGATRSRRQPDAPEQAVSPTKRAADTTCTIVSTIHATRRDLCHPCQQPIPTESDASAADGSWSGHPSCRPRPGWRGCRVCG